MQSEEHDRKRLKTTSEDMDLDGVYFPWFLRHQWGLILYAIMSAVLSGSELLKTLLNFLPHNPDFK